MSIIAKRRPAFRRSSSVSVGTMAVVVVSLTAVPAAAETLTESLAAIHQRAQTARAERNEETVERLRLERARILATTQEQSPWVNARRAIEAVDGSLADGEPGLVERLRYKEAAQRLIEAWKPFAEMRDGPVYGDVAVRLFKVGQQALAVHRDALSPGSPGEVVSAEFVRQAIEAAAARDPCQLEARVIALFLKRPDMNEMFRRMEVRPQLRAINAGLLGLAWRKKGAVLAHHAPVEFMKARLTAGLIAEQRYADFLAPESVEQDGSAGPVLMLRGSDARSAPFRLISGRFLLMEVADETERFTPAFIFVDQTGQWDKRYLRLLYRTPNAEELKDSEAAFFADFFSKLRPTGTWMLGPHAFALYDLPIGSTETLIRRGIRGISVRRAAGLSRAKYSLKSNDLEFLIDQLEPDPLPSHPQVLMRMQQYAAARDRSIHSLVDLMGLRPGERSTVLNPLLVVSADDRKRPTPSFKREEAVEHPFLTLDDANGAVMEFREATKELVVRYPGVDGHVPLTIDAIPAAMVLATAAGRVLESVLLDCGYAKNEAIDEIRKALKDPQYTPPRFDEAIKAKRPPGRGQMGLIARSIVADKGWEPAWTPVEDLQRGYRLYGFRHLTDARGTIISHPGLFAPSGVDQEPGDPAARRLDFRSPDGGKPIDETQVYSADDYEQLRRNMATDFLPAVAALHPCLPAIDHAEYRLPNADGEVAATIPDEIFAGWSASDVFADNALAGAMEGPGKQEALRRNRLFAEYARMTLAARSDPEPFDRLLAVQLKAARQLATTRSFHRSIVLYNELAKMISTREVEEERVLEFDLLNRVPTPADLEKYSADVQRLLEDQKRLLLVQAEQAAVLRAAGLPESANCLFRRLIDQFVHYILPAIELSEDYARSYAVAPGEHLEQTRQQVMEYLATITAAAAGLGREGEFRDAAVSGGLEAWAQDKVETRRLSPQRLLAGDFLVHPAQVCPATYDQDRGFVSEPGAVFADDLPAELMAWARLPAEAAARDPRAGLFQFLLGWYWLERKNPHFAWTAFIAAADAFNPERGRDDLPSLVGRRNGMMMLVAAAGVIDAPPGVSVVKTDFVDGLRGQAILWQRSWVTGLHDGSHAESQREAIDELLALVRTGIKRVETLDAKRYYFPDLTFRHGPLPDVLVADATAMKLFDAVPRDADDKPIEPPVATGQEAVQPQSGRPVEAQPPEAKPAAGQEEAKKEPEIPSRELTFEQFMNRLYTFPETIDPKILEGKTGMEKTGTGAVSPRLEDRLRPGACRKTAA